MAWTRLTLGLTTACLIAAAAPAAAQTPAKQAHQLNEEGKALLNAKPTRATEATAKFRAAIVLSPEGRFYLNLCMALYQEGKLGEALTACDAVEDKGATAAQVKQASVIVEKFIKPRMREAGLDPDNPGGNQTDPNNGNQTNPNAANNFTVAPPPSLLTQTTAAPTHEYTWTIGAQLLGLQTTIGEKGEWSKGTAGFRLLGDYAITKSKLIGAQGYISFFNVQATNDNFAHMDESVSVVDLGLAVYKEACRGRICIKPLAGLQIALLQPSDTIDGQGFSALGARAELGLEYALGKRYENVLTLGLGLNMYFPAAESDGAIDVPSDWGLDKSSANGYFAIGFTRRFATPLGSQPLFTLQ